MREDMCVLWKKVKPEIISVFVLVSQKIVTTSMFKHFPYKSICNFYQDVSNIKWFNKKRIKIKKLFLVSKKQLTSPARVGVGIVLEVQVGRVQRLEGSHLRLSRLVHAQLHHQRQAAEPQLEHWYFDITTYQWLWIYNCKSSKGRKKVKVLCQCLKK